MCYEDVKIGIRRWAVITSIAPGSTTLKANSKRVLLKVTLFGTTAAPTNAQIRPGDMTGNQGIMCLTELAPTDQLSLEVHGNIIFGQFNVTSSGNLVLMEVFDDSLDRPPPQGDPYSKPTFVDKLSTQQ